MLKQTPIVGSLLLLTACALDDGRPNFASMSAEELAAYNASVSYDEEVICRVDPQIGTLLRSKTCMTREQDYQSKRNDMQILRTINSGPVDVDLR